MERVTEKERVIDRGLAREGRRRGGVADWLVV